MDTHSAAVSLVNSSPLGGGFHFCWVQTTVKKNVQFETSLPLNLKVGNERGGGGRTKEEIRREGLGKTKVRGRSKMTTTKVMTDLWRSPITNKEMIDHIERLSPNFLQILIFLLLTYKLLVYFLGTSPAAVLSAVRIREYTDRALATSAPRLSFC